MQVPHKRLTSRLIAVFAVLAMVVAACGGEAGDDTTTTAATGDDTTTTADDGATTTTSDDGDETTTTEGEMAMPGEGVEVTMGRATWNTGYMQSHIFKQLLEELGYTVSEPADLEVGAAQFYPALAQGDADFWANGWFPLHTPILDTELPDGSTAEDHITPIGLQVEAGALQGYLMDTATIEAEGITSMADLEDPDVAAIFDTDGNGLANLIGCDDGWGCNQQIEAHINGGEGVEPLGWGENVEQVVGQYSALMADVQSRVQQGEPVLYYTWTPNWTVDVLPPGDTVMWVESPEQSDVEGQTTVEGLEGCTNDPCQMGWTPNDIRVVANNEFLEANPAAEALFEVVEIPLSDIAAQNAEMNEATDYAESDIAEDAAEWIEANRDQVDEWLETARSAG